MALAVQLRPAPAVKIGEGAVVCAEASLHGDITIGPGAVIHPQATIIALAGPIVIESNCIIEENVVLQYSGPYKSSSTSPSSNSPSGPITPSSDPLGVTGSPEKSDGSGPEMRVGEGCVFEVGSFIAASSIGPGCLVEAKAVVEIGAVMGKRCVVGAGSRVAPGESLEDFTAVWGLGGIGRRTMEPVTAATTMPGHVSHLELLRKALTKHHRMFGAE